MSAANLFSLIALSAAALIMLGSLLILRLAAAAGLLEHTKLFLIFSGLSLASLASLRWLDPPRGWEFLIAFVVWEELQKGFASRISELPATSVCAVFAAAELAVVKSNVLLHTPGYLDNITAQNVFESVLRLLPAAGMHILTGVIYFLLRTKLLALPLLLCSLIHFGFNALIWLAYS